MKIRWDGTLLIRRYAMFTDIIRGNYIILVRGDDIDRAEKWGSFVRWIGEVHPAEMRRV